MGISRDQAISFVTNGCIDILTHSEWANDPIVQVEAIKNSPMLIKYIQNPSIPLQKLAVETDWNTIKFMNNPHTDVQLLAITKSKDAIPYVDANNEFIKKFLDNLK